jgi:hypothetical protein
MHPFPDHSQATHLRRPPDRLTIGGPVRLIPTTAVVPSPMEGRDWLWWCVAQTTITPVHVAGRLGRSGRQIGLLTSPFAWSGWRDLNSRPLDPQIGGICLWVSSERG